MPEETVFADTPETKPVVEATPDPVLQEDVDKLKERGLDELAKGKAHADRFIDFLEAQNKDLKSELDTRLSAEATLQEIKQSRASEVSEERTTSGLKPDDDAVSDEDIVSLVDKRIGEAAQNKIVQDNILLVDKKIKGIYGDKAGAFIDEKAAELGLSKEALGELAAQSPKAFFDMVRVEDKPSGGPAMTTGTVNPEALAVHSPGDVKPGTDRWYKALRKEDKVHFYTPAVQQRLFKDRERLGDKFYE